MKRAINLLPVDRKNNLKIQKFNLFLIKNGVVLMLALLVFVIFTASNLFILNIYDKINSNKEDKQENIAGSVIEETKREIDNKYSETEELMGHFNQKSHFLDYFGKINESLPGQVYFKEISIDKEVLLINGWAENRDSLLDFEKSLKQKDFFKKIEMPISNLTSQENVNFEIVIDLKNI